MFKKKRASIKFVGRKQSLYGLISTVIGSAGLLSIAALFYVTTKSDGTTSTWVGLAGLAILVATLAGLIVGASSFKQKDIFYTLPIIGVVMNGIIFLGMVVLYFLGLSMMASL